MQSTKGLGCFPTGRHYPGIADAMAKSKIKIQGLVSYLAADTRWQGSKIAVIDFETTGFSAQTERVIEMGIVLFSDGMLEASHNFLINPGRAVPPQSTKVHGITDEMLADKPSFDAIADEIAALLVGRIPVAYNANFDKGFLLAEIGRLSDFNPPHDVGAFDSLVTWIDPLVWVRELQKYERGKKLTDVCARMGIELSDAHRAYADAEATGHVLMKLAQDMPANYGELIRIQTQYGAQQELEFAKWRKRKGS